jgi:hypothetical protein
MIILWFVGKSFLLQNVKRKDKKEGKEEKEQKEKYVDR